MAFVLWHRPLHDNHLVVIAVALAVPVGTSIVATITQRTRFPFVALAALVVVFARRLLPKHAPTQPECGVVAVVRHMGGRAGRRARAHLNQLVVSDEPIIPFYAHRTMPGSTIDTALLRFDTGYITDADVLDAISRYDVPVVVAARAFLTRPTLLAAFAKRFGRPRTRDGVRIYAASP